MQPVRVALQKRVIGYLGKIQGCRKVFHFSKSDRFKNVLPVFDRLAKLYRTIPFISDDVSAKHFFGSVAGDLHD